MIFSTSFFTPRTYNQKYERFFLECNIARFFNDQRLQTLSISAIKHHLEQKNDCLQSILNNLFVTANIEGKPYMYFSAMRCNTKDGGFDFDIDLILSLILEKYKLLSDQQIIKELFKPNYLSNNCSPFSSPYTK